MTLNPRLIIDGKDQVPDAQATPAGRPDTSTEAQVAANAKMLWLAVRETIRHANGAVLPDRRDGIAGLLWRGNPAAVAVSLWDGMDQSGITDQVMAELYDHLRLTRHLLRADEGSQGRKWWVADQWDGTRVPRPYWEEAVRPLTGGEIASLKEAPANGELPVRVMQPAADPAEALQAVLTEIRLLRDENQRLRATVSADGDQAEMTGDNLRLRSENQELREHNKALRAQVAAAETVLGQSLDDIS